MKMDFDILLDDVSIKEKVTTWTRTVRKGDYCAQISLSLVDPSLYDEFDFTIIETDTRIEVKTKKGDSWYSQGHFFIESKGAAEIPGQVTLPGVWGRGPTAVLGPPFAVTVSKTWEEDTSFYLITKEMLELCGLDYDPARILIDDYKIWAGSYTVEGKFPYEIINELAKKTDGILCPSRDGNLWVLKERYTWSGYDVEIPEVEIKQLDDNPVIPRFGNRMKVGSFTGSNESNVRISLSLDETRLIADGVDSTPAKAVITFADGKPVGDGYAVEWTSGNDAFAQWQNIITHTQSHLIEDEEQEATWNKRVSTSYSIRQVRSVHLVGDESEFDYYKGGSFEGSSIVLGTALPFTDSAVSVTYMSAWAENTLVAGTTGEVEVDVHAIVEVFVRDTQTMRIDTASGEATAEQAAYVTVVTRDAITEEIITLSGNVRLDDALKGATIDGIIDLGLISGGDHSISIRDVPGYKDTDEPDGLANDEIRVGQTVYTTTGGEETTNPNLITNHDDLVNIKGNGTLHLSEAERALIGTGGGGDPGDTVVEETGFGQGSTPGVSEEYSRADHTHGSPEMPDVDDVGADPVGTAAAAVGEHAALDTGVHGAGGDTLATDVDIAAAIGTHEEAADPHAGYRLESADHTHQNTGLQGGKLDHGLALTGLGDDDHSQYALLAGRDGDVLKIDEVRAYDGAGLTLADDSGTLGIFVKDGGRVGINRSAPGAPLEISGTMQIVETNSFSEQICLCYSDTKWHTPFIKGQKAEGIEGSPAAVTNNHWLLAIVSKGWDGSDWEYGVRMIAYVQGAVSTGVVPGKWRFTTCDSAGVEQNALILDNAQNLIVNDATPGTNAKGTIAIENGTAPTSSPANMVHLYAEDVAGSSELKARDEAGNTPTLSPHHFQLFTPDPDYYYPWSHHSKNPFTGREMEVDMYGISLWVQEQAGKQFIYTRDLPPGEREGWDTVQALNRTNHDEREQFRIDDEVTKLMEKEVEVIKEEAVERVEIMETITGKKTEKVLDAITGNLMNCPIKEQVGTGSYRYQVKKGMRLDTKMGKFYRKKTEAEALAEVAPAVPYVPKDPPAWMVPLLPKKTIKTRG